MHIGLRFNIAGYLIFRDIARISYSTGHDSARIKDEGGTSCLFLAEMSRNNIGTAPE